MGRSAAQPSFPRAMEELRSEYTSARDNRFRRKRPGVSANPRTGDQGYPSESRFLEEREYARDMAANDPAIVPLIDLAVTQTIQDGFKPDPKTPESDANKRLKDEWAEYSEDPEQVDVAGEHAFVDMEIGGCRSILVDGDGLAIGTDTGALQVFEAHRLRTPRKIKRNIVYGVELSEFRRREQFWIAKEGVDISGRYERAYDFDVYDARDPGGAIPGSNAIIPPYRQVFHFYNCKRSSQTRGLTALKPVVDLASSADDTIFAQTVKTQFAAMVVGFLKRNNDFVHDSQMGDRKSSTLPDGTTQFVEQLSAGMFLRGHKGEDLELKSTNVNTQETLEFVRLLIQLVGLNLGLPLILALLDASRSNMSSARVDTDNARMGFKRNQKEFVRRFHRPVWRWWLLRKCFTDDYYARLYAKHGPALLACNWKTPRWPYIDPWKDVNSNALKMSTMQSSPRRVVGDGEFDEIVDETVEDRFSMWSKAFDAWKRLIKAHPEAEKMLTVRDMLNLDLYKGGQVIDSADTDNGQDGAGKSTGQKTTAA